MTTHEGTKRCTMTNKMKNNACFSLKL